MKKIFTTLALFAMVFTVSFAQEATTISVDGQEVSAEGPTMEFDQTEIDYGTIEKGSDKIRIFNFKNTGTEPLVIKHAKGSCGCTVPTYPKEPILPGEAAEIKVSYDTNRIGRFSKTVTLTTNEAVEKRVLRIKGEVLAPAPEPEAIPESTGGF